MFAPTRSALPLALTLGLLVVALPARAQEAETIAAPVTHAVAEAPYSSPTSDSVAAPVTVGPTLQAASVAVRHIDDHTVAAAPRRGGSAPGVPLMVVGGAAIIGGLVVGSGAGGAIAVGGLVLGLYGLYLYLQ